MVSPVVAPIAPMRGNYQDNVEDVHAADLLGDISAWYEMMQGLVFLVSGGWNTVVTGCQLTAGSGLQVNSAAGSALINGVYMPIPAGSQVAAAPASNSYYGVYYALIGETASTEPGSNNPTKYNSITFGIYYGAPAENPTVPNLPDSTYLQLGTVLIAAGQTTFGPGQATLNSGAYAPNAQGPFKSALDLASHLNQSVLTSSPHGAQATSAGGTQANRLAYTSPSGYVGGAGSVWDGAAYRLLSAYNSGAHAAGTIPLYNSGGMVENSALLQGYSVGGAAGQIPILNGNARVNDSEHLQGYIPGSFDSAGAANAVQASLNGHTGTSLATGTVHGLRVQAFTVSHTLQAGLSTNQAIVAFNFPVGFTSVHSVSATGRSKNGGGNPLNIITTGIYVVDGSVTNTGFQLSFGGDNGNGYTWTVDVVAVGT